MASVFQKTGLFAKINNLFLSVEDKKYFKRVESIDAATAQDLKQEVEELLHKYGRRYAIPEPHDVPFSGLPTSVSAFFSDYDYLSFEIQDNTCHLLDSRSIRRQDVGETTYYVIGCDVKEDTCFLVKAKGMYDQGIYGASSRFYCEKDEPMRGSDVELVFQSFEHLLAYYANELSIPVGESKVIADK
jgi:hypothetical protein